MTDSRLTLAKRAGPCAMVIFGAGGDLTRRLVVPALYNLASTDLLPDEFAIVGMDLADMNGEQWGESLKTMTKEFVDTAGHSEFDEKVWAGIRPRLNYIRGDLNDPATYENLKTKLSSIDGDFHSNGNYLFYLAIADRFFGPAVKCLGESGLAREEDGHWRRVVIEKPFGHDLASAKALNKEILCVLNESQIYRIDHFLGKETVQNIMMFRFANGMFEPIWNRDRIDHIQITVAETVGVEKRGRFYESTGALRDMVPNHLFQLVAMTAMEAPNSFSADAVRTEKEKVIEAIRVCSPEEVACIAVRGQYGPGEIDGQPVAGYRQEPDVSPSSQTETYAALKLSIDNWRWSGVPFYLRTGKRLARRKSQIAIRFKETPAALFRKTEVRTPAPNWLLLRIQPDEGIALEFGAKIPGPVVKLGDVRMDFKYEDYFGTAPRTGYETLLYDVMIGDATLFQRADNVEAGWRVVQPVLDVWRDTPPKCFPNYTAGGEGPGCADELLAREGRSWRAIS
ncbi:MAG: glucose-6-phosphate dehydrogenase [Acidobacteriaceae bacterium]|nr:glucose-6-phosphate dehydrogenase [Acidobacteriaceae bacterium]